MGKEMIAAYCKCVLLFWVFINENLAICDFGTCNSGQLWNGTVCLSCPTGYYQTRENHKCQNCVPCTEENADTVMVKKCSATENAQFKCRPGTTRYNENDLVGLECTSCRVCPAGYRAVSECTEDTDTACEPQPQSTEASMRNLNQSEPASGTPWETTSATLTDNQTSSVNTTNNNNTSTNTTADGGNQRTIAIVVPVVVVFVLLTCVIVLIVWCFLKRRRGKQPITIDDHDEREQMTKPEDINMLELSLRQEPTSLHSG